MTIYDFASGRVAAPVQSLCQHLLKGVRKELKLGQTSLFRPHNLLDKNRSWHVSIDGVAKMCVFV